MNEIYEQLITLYLENSIGIANNFLSPNLAEQLKNNLLHLEEEDKLHLAGVGSAARHAFKPEIRKDKIFWLDRKNNDQFEMQFFGLIEDFIRYLNMTCYTGISDFEFHYTIYEPGSFYKKHKDQFQDSNKRQFSVITYLNPNWHENDGGELLIYKPTGEEKILPAQGKTVFFKSNELEHEVLPTHRERMSLTGWLRKG